MNPIYNDTEPNFLETLAKGLYGITIHEAHAQAICIDCKKPMSGIGFPTNYDVKEYVMSGLCHICWDKSMSPKE